MLKRLLWIALATLLFSSTTFAANYGRIDYKNETLPAACETEICDPFHFVMTLTGGVAFANIGESETFTDDSSIYSYAADSGSQRKGMWGAAIGEEYQFTPQWALQLNIAYYQIATFTATGIVTQGVDPDTYESFAYDYQVSSQQYLLEAKILGDAGNHIHPYILAGIGASFNTVNGYDTNSAENFVTFTPQFDGRTNIDFSYSLGVGVDFDIATFARLGIGYRFTGLGDAKLGDGTINTVYITHSFGQENLNAQEAILQLTFLI